MRTRVAIPVWCDAVSMAFDFSRQLWVVSLEDNREVSRHEVSLKPAAPGKRAAELKELEVDTLVCGAISRPLASAVAQAGIRVIPFVAGSVDEVLGAFMCGRLADPRFLLAGSPPGARRRWRHGQCFRANRSRNCNQQR